MLRSDPLQKTHHTHTIQGFCLLVAGNTGYHKKKSDDNKGSETARFHLFSTSIPSDLFPRHYLEKLADAVAGEGKKDS